MATSSNTYQPPPRHGHCSVVIEGVTYSWGGDSTSNLRTVDVFNGEYRKVTTTGDGPECVVYSSCAVVGKTIFHWGGVRRGSGRPSSNDLYCITVGEWEWRKVQVTNPQDAPPPKKGSRMVALGDKLVVVGGKTADKYTNDTHVFDIQRGRWSQPSVSGVYLPPNSDFSLTKVDNRFCIVYGGHNGRGTIKNVYVLDAETWKYSSVVVSGPVGRHSHGACLLMSQPHPQLLVTGGVGNGGDLKDSWVVEVHIADGTAVCREVILPEDTSYRRRHTTTTIISGASPMVVVDGGLRGRRADTVVLTLAVDHAGGGAGGWRVREVVQAMNDPGRALELMSSARVQVAITTQDPQFPGIHFLGTPWKETVTSEGQEISWDSIGVAFSIPPGAVPEEEPLQLTVRPCLTGPFQPPDQYQLTSPSYQVSSSAKFTRDIEVVVYHSVNLRTDDDCKRMTFLSAPSVPTCDGSQPQYKYEVLRGGVFRKDESFGTIKLRQPSDLAIATTGPKLPDTYSARLYSNSETPDGPCTRAIFCMVPYQPLYAKHLEAYMDKSEPGIKMSVVSIEEPVEFADTTVEANMTLELPSETPGYKIVPAKKPLKISRRQLDCVLQSSTELPDSYPKKLSLNISPEGTSATPPSRTWDLAVLGLKEELSFTLGFPPLPTAKLITQTTTVSATVSLSQADGVLNRLLTTDDLREVYYKMYPQMVNWRHIGLHLGLPHYILDNIGDQYRKNEQRLEKVLVEWLRRRKFRPSWQSLIDALRHQTVDDEGAAEDLLEYLLSRAAAGGVEPQERHQDAVEPQEQSHQEAVTPPVAVEPQEQSHEDTIPLLVAVEPQEQSHEDTVPPGGVEPQERHQDAVPPPVAVEPQERHQDTVPLLVAVEPQEQSHQDAVPPPVAAEHRGRWRRAAGALCCCRVN